MRVICEFLSRKSSPGRTGKVVPHTHARFTRLRWGSIRGRSNILLDCRGRKCPRFEVYAIEPAFPESVRVTLPTLVFLTRCRYDPGEVQLVCSRTIAHIDAADAGRYAYEHISADVYFKIDIFLCGGLVDRLVDFPNLRFKSGPTFQR